MPAGINEAPTPHQRRAQLLGIPGDVDAPRKADANPPWTAPFNEVAVEDRPVFGLKLYRFGAQPDRQPRLLKGKIAPHRLNLPGCRAIENRGKESLPLGPAGRHARAGAKLLRIGDIGQKPFLPQPLRHARHVDHTEALSLVAGERVALDAAEPLGADQLASPVVNLCGGKFAKRRHRH